MRFWILIGALILCQPSGARFVIKKPAASKSESQKSDSKKVEIQEIDPKAVQEAREKATVESEKRLKALTGGEIEEVSDEEPPSTAPSDSELNIKVTGDKDAELLFEGVKLTKLPELRIKDDVLEFILPQMKLSASANGEANLVSPHPLIEKVTVKQLAEGIQVQVKSKKKEHLKERAKAFLASKGLRIKLSEQKPIAKKAPVPKKMASGDVWGAMGQEFEGMLFVGLILLAAAGGYFIYLRKKKSKGVSTNAKSDGVIESIAHCDLEAKPGVRVVRVGKEYLLLGITNQQISLLAVLSSPPQGDTLSVAASNS